MAKLRKILTSAMALSLIAAMALGLSGCGKDDGNGGNNSGDNSGDNQTASGYVYVPEYTKVDTAARYGFNSVAYTADGFYGLSNEVIGSNIPEGVTPEWEGQYDIYGNILYKIGFDGKTEKLASFADTQLPEGQEGSVNINNMQAAPDGTLYLLEDVYTYTVNIPDGVEVEEYSDEYWNYYESQETYNIRHIAADGSELGTYPLSGLSEDEYAYYYEMHIDGQGNIYLPSDQSVFVLDSEGKLLCNIQCDNWIQSVAILADGSAVCMYYGNNGMTCSKIDLEKKAFGDSIELPNNVYNIISGGGDYDFYYSNSINLYGYKIATGESEKLLNWLSLGIDSNNMGGSDSMVVLPDGRVAALTTEWDDSLDSQSVELLMLTQKPASSVAQRKTITLATMSLDWQSRSQIIDFNKTNTEYVIDVRDYSEYNTEDDYSAGMTKLTTEILSGKMPDILDLNGLPVNQLAAKGMLEDLYPYLDSDSELSRDDIFPSVLKALENDGKLYSTCSGFYIQTVLGASSVVGDTPGWTVQQFKAALASMPEGCTAFDQYTTRDTIMYYCLALDLDSFVDWNTGKCSFDSQSFVDMLEFVKSFPSEFDWDSYEYTDEDSAPARIAAGKQMLLSTSLSDFSDFQMYKAIFGGKVTCIGFPTDYGNGNMMGLSSGYAISSGSANKDAAWQFLRGFFTEDYQTDNVWQFPSNVNAFNKKLKEAMTPHYQKDENGNYILDENGNKIEESQGGWGWGSVTIEIKAVTQEEADQILDLINTTTKVMRADETISKTVNDEAAAFFEGQKTAEEVAKTIQSKVSIYVNEQR